jgi:hypothetical protein
MGANILKLSIYYSSVFTVWKRKTVHPSCFPTERLVIWYTLENPRINVVWLVLVRACPTLETNSIGGVMVSGFASSVVDRGFEPRSGQTKDYKIDVLLLQTLFTWLFILNLLWLLDQDIWHLLRTRVDYLRCQWPSHFKYEGLSEKKKHSNLKEDSL